MVVLTGYLVQAPVGREITVGLARGAFFLSLGAGLASNLVFPAELVDWTIIGENTAKHGS